MQGVLKHNFLITKVVGYAGGVSHLLVECRCSSGKDVTMLVSLIKVCQLFGKLCL